MSNNDKKEQGPELTDREEVKRILQRACDRDWKDETLYQTAIIASNAIYWRDMEIKNLKEQLSATAQLPKEAERLAWDTIKEFGCHIPERTDVKLAKALLSYRYIGEKSGG